MDAELGNINVLSVVPGVYTDKELERVTRHIAHIRVFNGGHTCPSVQVGTSQQFMVDAMFLKFRKAKNFMHIWCTSLRTLFFGVSLQIFTYP